MRRGKRTRRAGSGERPALPLFTCHPEARLRFRQGATRPRAGSQVARPGVEDHAGVVGQSAGADVHVRRETRLPEGPFDFGFLPSTVSADGDPLDIMVVMDAPAHVGCLIEVRIIGITGIITAAQTEDGKTETNNRLIGVAIHSYDHEDLKATSWIRCKSFSSRITSSVGRDSRLPAPAVRRRRYSS